jgi:hypothetical protein
VATVADKARVFTERDVRELLRPLLRTLDDYRVDRSGPGREALSEEALERVLVQVVKDTPSELTEEVIARSRVDELVALALVWGAHDYDGLPSSVWDRLYERKLLSSAGDQSGESWAVLSRAGEAFLRAELERDR